MWASNSFGGSIVILVGLEWSGRVRLVHGSSEVMDDVVGGLEWLG